MSFSYSNLAIYNRVKQFKHLAHLTCVGMGCFREHFKTSYYCSYCQIQVGTKKKKVRLGWEGISSFQMNYHFIYEAPRAPILLGFYT
jgi:hypothetical protein